MKYTEEDPLFGKQSNIKQLLRMNFATLCCICEVFLWHSIFFCFPLGNHLIVYLSQNPSHFQNVYSAAEILWLCNRSECLVTWRRVSSIPFHGRLSLGGACSLVSDRSTGSETCDIDSTWPFRVNSLLYKKNFIASSNLRWRRGNATSN